MITLIAILAGGTHVRATATSAPAFSTKRKSARGGVPVTTSICTAPAEGAAAQRGAARQGCHDALGRPQGRRGSSRRHRARRPMPGRCGCRQCATSSRRSYGLPATVRVAGRGTGPMTNFAQRKDDQDAKLPKMAGRPGLRRTARPMMSGAGVRPDTLAGARPRHSRYRGHVYDRIAYAVEKADSVTGLAALVERILNLPAIMWWSYAQA